MTDARRFPLGRRASLVGGLSALAAPAIVRATPPFAGDPFVLGVASGEPAPDGFVIWTRLLVNAAFEGPPPDERFVVRWQVAEDEGFARIAREGEAVAGPEEGHTLHVEVAGLRPDREYWYRFLFQGRAGQTGRARTLPAAGATLARRTLAFASCQNFEHAHYAAWRDVAERAPDAVLFLGDYIYEGGSRRPISPARRHLGGECRTLDEYRRRYAQYKNDPQLKAAHAACVWHMIWDDHEVENDYADDRGDDGISGEAFLARRAAAYQAWWEHMPLRRAQKPVGAACAMHRRVVLGDLATLHLCDTRQHRSHQVCAPPGRGGNGRADASCPDRLRPDLTMLGAAQERWLADGLAAPGARWNLVAQSVPFAPLDFDVADGELRRSDNWDGYVAARGRLVEAMARRPGTNPVVLTGDLHANVVADVRREPQTGEGQVVASEFVGTSIASWGGSRITNPAATLRKNPHLHFADASSRGYGLATVTPGRFEVELRTVADSADPASLVGVAARFAIEAGRPGVQRA